VTSTLKQEKVAADPLADNILRAIRRILRKAAEDRQQLALDGDLSVSELLCLRRVAAATTAHPITVAGVASAVQLSNATVSRISDRLDAAGCKSQSKIAALGGEDWPLKSAAHRCAVL